MNKKNTKLDMRIAIVAPLWLPVPPETYGGIETIVYLLVEELVRRGYNITLFAPGNSKTSAKLKSVTKYGVHKMMIEGKAFEYEHYANACMAQVLMESRNFDIIHFHIDVSKIPLTSLSSAHTVYTIHTVISPDDIWTLSHYRDNVVTAVSNSQIASLADTMHKDINVIYNACNFDDFSAIEISKPHLVFLGRMGKQKNPLDAILIAKAAGLPIILAGEPQNPGEQVYFRESIMPLVDGKDVQYIGPVNHIQKKELLKNAAALVFPITWPEPFGLILIEAMASGVPVLAYKKGSVAEVVDYGKTGFYADSMEDLVALVPKALALNRKSIREYARKRFDYHKMVDAYVSIYESFITKKQF